VIPILGSAAMRTADREAVRAGTPSELLMENAAAALTSRIRDEFPDWTRVAVLCGPGNNGGDGLAAARLLACAGVAPVIFTLREPSAYSGDAAVNAGRARSLGLALHALSGASGLAHFRRALSECDGVLDALFGTGLTRGLEGTAARAVAAMNACGKPIVAADVPSGLAADRGQPPGPAARASITVAFAAPKPCHVLAPASGFCGRVVVADIGIARPILTRRAARLWLAEADDVAALLPARPRDSHKADFGRLAVIAGSRGKAGAAILAARGALRGGAGLVTVFAAESLTDLVTAALPEAMTFGLPETRGCLDERAAPALLRALRTFDAAVVGPGLSTSPGLVRLLQALLAGSRIPLVLDADALNAFAGNPRALAPHRGPVVLTPHPGEAGRLLGIPPGKIQADRLGAARAIARRSRAICVLKGSHTLIAAPDGQTIVNPTGSPLLSTAGSGDVLAGLIGALLAGGLAPRDAAMAGVWLHGAAADALAPRFGDAGLLAHEVADSIPAARLALRRP
jgi:NAD(P)H-hydrate epimerase